MDQRDDFVAALVAAPVGAALLGLLEGTARDDAQWWEVPSTSRPDAVAAAAEAVPTWTIGRLLALAVYAGRIKVGPWIPSAAVEVTAAYRRAEARLPIAEAIDAAFGDELHCPIDVDVQQWWHVDRPGADVVTAPQLGAFDSVYGAGQFTWGGLWTVSDPAPETPSELVAAWEMDTGPLSRWRLPVRPGARVVEVHRPEHWAALVTRHPAVAQPLQEGWELPGRNQSVDELDLLMSLTNQRAARTTIRRHLVPDWASVAADWDSVHLSWAGMLTAEGCITDVGDGDVTMMRYWFSERTHWLSDAFGDPEPLDAPDLDADGDGLRGVDVRADPIRRANDEHWLRAKLGRRSTTS